MLGVGALNTINVVDHILYRNIGLRIKYIIMRD